MATKLQSPKRTLEDIYTNPFNIAKLPYYDVNPATLLNAPRYNATDPPAPPWNNLGWGTVGRAFFPKPGDSGKNALSDLRDLLLPKGNYASQGLTSTPNNPGISPRLAADTTAAFGGANQGLQPSGGTNTMLLTPEEKKKKRLELAKQQAAQAKALNAAQKAKTDAEYAAINAHVVADGDIERTPGDALTPPRIVPMPGSPDATPSTPPMGGFGGMEQVTNANQTFRGLYSPKEMRIAAEVAKQADDDMALAQATGVYPELAQENLNRIREYRRAGGKSPLMDSIKLPPGTKERIEAETAAEFAADKAHRDEIIADPRKAKTTEEQKWAVGMQQGLRNNAEYSAMADEAGAGYRRFEENNRPDTWGAGDVGGWSPGGRRNWLAAGGAPNAAPWSNDVQAQNAARTKGLIEAAGASGMQQPYGGWEDEELVKMAADRRRRALVNDTTPNNTTRPSYDFKPTAPMGLAANSPVNPDGTRNEFYIPGQASIPEMSAWQQYNQKMQEYAKAVDNGTATAAMYPGAWKGETGRAKVGDTWTNLGKPPAGSTTQPDGTVLKPDGTVFVNPQGLIKADEANRKAEQKIRQSVIRSRAEGNPMTYDQAQAIAGLTGGPDDKNKIVQLAAAGVPGFDQIAGWQQQGITMGNRENMTANLQQQRILNTQIRIAKDTLGTAVPGSPEFIQAQEIVKSAPAQLARLQSTMNGDEMTGMEQQGLNPSANPEYDALRDAEMVAEKGGVIGWANALRSNGWPFAKIEAEGKKRWKAEWDKKDWSFMQRAVSGGNRLYLLNTMAPLNIGLKW